MLAAADFVGFIPITDVARSRAFYEGVLGLPVIEESPFALVLDVNGTMLRLTPVGDHRPQPFTIAGWAVDNLEDAVRQLVSAGIEVNKYDGMEQDDDGIWDSPSGARIAWFRDPDDNTLSLTTF